MSLRLLSRRGLGVGAAFFGAGLGQTFAQKTAYVTIPAEPTAERPDPQVNADAFSEAKTVLAFRDHGFQNELVSQSLTPLGEHYLLTHFGPQFLSAENYTVAIGGLVASPRKVPLQDIMLRSVINQVVTMECAGIGRRDLSPRPVYGPWGTRISARISGSRRRCAHSWKRPAYCPTLSRFCSPDGIMVSISASSTPSSAACPSPKRCATRWCWPRRTTGNRCCRNMAIRCG